VRPHTTHARERSLRRLGRVNRWLLAGSVTLTGVLTEVTAHAFPGKSKPRSRANTAKGHTHTHHVNPGGSSKSSKSIRPPAQAPQAAPERETEGTPPEAASESPSARESPPAEESAAASEAAPEPEVAPAHEAAPQPAPEAEAPVVSGGS
jgi:hypothetical protein